MRVFVLYIYVSLHRRKPCEGPVCCLRSPSRCMQLNFKNPKSLNSRTAMVRSQLRTVIGDFTVRSSIRSLDSSISVRRLASRSAISSCRLVTPTVWTCASYLYIEYYCHSARECDLCVRGWCIVCVCSCLGTILTFVVSPLYFTVAKHLH